MQPWFEKVTVPDGQSWTLFDRRLPEFPFNWHYHPEFELTLTLNSEGERFIGDHVAHYGERDLILVGPNLPHAWQSRAALNADLPHRALVVWFSESWAHGLTQHYAELAGLDDMLRRAARGLAFGDATRDAVKGRLLSLVDASPARRWLGLVDILLLLTDDAASRPLALHGFVQPDDARDRARIERVLAYLNDRYTEPVRLSEVASLASMSESQLQRFFKQCTRMTLTDYLVQLRIGRACALLLENDRPIALIAEEAGYRQPGYFTRQFRALKGMTPMEFRRRFAARPGVR